MFNRHHTANPYADASGSTKNHAVIGLCVKQSLYATTVLRARLEFLLVYFVFTYALM